MLKKAQLDCWWSRFFLIVATYVIAADVIPNLLFMVIESIGYLPYSDRPGPGWFAPHLLSGPELGFYAGFAFLLLRGTAFCGLFFGLAGLILGFCSLPRWAHRLLAGSTAFLASGLLMAGAGWLIAIAAVGVYIAAGCGALWGIFVFPRLVPRFSRSLPAPCRIALPIIMFIGGTYWLIRPLLPNPGLTNAKIEVLRRDDTGSDLSRLDLSFVGTSIVGGVQSSGKYISVNRMEFTTDDRNQVRVLLIIDDDRPVPRTFRLPRSGNVIYRQSGGMWNEERVESRDSEISITLRSGDGTTLSLETDGPCCSSMSQSFAPYR